MTKQPPKIKEFNARKLECYFVQCSKCKTFYNVAMGENVRFIKKLHVFGIVRKLGWKSIPLTCPECLKD